MWLFLKGYRASDLSISARYVCIHLRIAHSISSAGQWQQQFQQRLVEGIHHRRSGRKRCRKPCSDHQRHPPLVLSRKKRYRASPTAVQHSSAVQYSLTIPCSPREDIRRKPEIANAVPAAGQVALLDNLLDYGFAAVLTELRAEMDVKPGRLRASLQRRASLLRDIQCWAVCYYLTLILRCQNGRLS